MEVGKPLATVNVEVHMTRKVGRSIHDEPKAHWRAYQPQEKSLAPRRSAMDYESMAATMESEPVTMTDIDKARRTIASNAVDASDASELMMMLGIHPSQEQESGPLLAPNSLPNPN